MRPSPNRPARRAAATLPPDEELRPPRGRQRRHPGRPAAFAVVASRQQAQQQRQVVVGQRSATAGLDAEVLVLLEAVPYAEHVGDTAAADDVQDAHVLCQADRVVEGQHQRGKQDR